MAGNKHARCPRRPLLEQPEWWPKLMLAYSAYKSGFLPQPGAMGQQHAMFPELMYWIETFLDHYGTMASGDGKGQVEADMSFTDATVT